MFCFWCQSKSIPKRMREKGFVWLHEKCFGEIIDFKDDLKKVREIIEGKEEKSETVERFLRRMEQFDAHFKELEKVFQDDGK